MTGCGCQLAAAGGLGGRLNSEQPDERAEAVDCLVGLLTSKDEGVRRHGYAVFKEGVDEAMFRSCLNYRALIGSVTHSLLEVVARVVEFWAEAGVEQGQENPSGPLA